MKVGTLFKKEIGEIFRTSRLYVVPGVFLFFGLVSPITSKMLPEIVKSVAGGTGVEIVIPPPTAVDSFLQFFKNLGQIGILAVILTMMGAVAEEKSRGTALLVVTKPVSRTALVVAKFLTSIMLVTAAMTVAYLLALGYTMVLFPDVPAGASLQATVLLDVYLIFIVGLTVAASAAARNQVAAGGLAIAGFFLVSVLPTLERWLGPVSRWSPGTLSGLANRVLTGATPFREALTPALVSLVLAVLLVLLGALVFERQEL